MVGGVCTEKLLSPTFSLLRTNPSTDSTPYLWKSRHIVVEERPFLELKNMLIMNLTAHQAIPYFGLVTLLFLRLLHYVPLGDPT